MDAVSVFLCSVVNLVVEIEKSIHVVKPLCAASKSCGFMLE